MTTRILVTIAATLLAASAAVASGMNDSSDRYCGTSKQGEWMPVAQISSKLSALGYSVREIERDDGCYEVHAKDKNGQFVEVYVDPVSGDVRKIELDD